MAETQHLDRTTIELAGKVDSSLGGATRTAEANLRKIETTGAHATSSLERGFAKASASINSGLGSLGTKMVGLGVGLATAIAGFSSLGEFIDKALEAASEEKVALTTRRLKTALQNNRFIARQGTEAINEQAEAIGKTAERMEKYSGTSAAIFRASYTTLAVHKATSREINVIATGMADYLALTKGVGATLEDATELSNKIVAAVETHKLGRFARELGLTPEDQARWKGLNSNMERLIFLQSQLEKVAGGQGAAQVGSLAGKLLLAQNEKTRIFAEYGAIFKEIQLKWEIAGNQMMKVALPWAKPVVEQIGRSFDDLSRTIQAIWKNLSSPAMAGFWKEWAKDVSAFQTTLKPLSEAIAKAFTSEAMTKDMKEFFENIQADMHTIETITSWVQKMGEAFDKSADAVERLGKMLRGEIKAPTTITNSDRVSNAQDRLNAMVLAGASDEDIAKAKKELLDAEEAQRKNTEATKQSTEAITRSQDSVTSSLASLDLAARAAANALRFPGSGMGNFPISGTGGVLGSLEPLTEYGPGVDWPGHGTPDSDSSKGLGHIGGVPYHLEEGDSAMKADYARKHYHIKPGDSYISDKDHKLHRWRDTTGARNPENEDIFREKKPIPYRPGASINYNPTIHLNGPADHGSVSSLSGILQDHSRHLLELLQKANDADYRTSFA